MNITLETVTRFVPFEVPGLVVVTTVVPETDNQGEPCQQCSDEFSVNDVTVYHAGTTVDCCPSCAPVVAALLGPMDTDTPVFVELGRKGFHGTHVAAAKLGYDDSRSYDPTERRRVIVSR